MNLNEKIWMRKKNSWNFWIHSSWFKWRFDFHVITNVICVINYHKHFFYVIFHLCIALKFKRLFWKWTFFLIVWFKMSFKRITYKLITTAKNVLFVKIALNIWFKMSRLCILFITITNIAKNVKRKTWFNLLTKIAKRDRNMKIRNSKWIK